MGGEEGGSRGGAGQPLRAAIRGGRCPGCVKDGAVEGGGDDGGRGGGLPSCGSGWSLLAFTVAKKESVPIEGDRCLTGEAGVENASRLPERNSCHRQMFSSCGGAWRVAVTMVVVVVVVEKVMLLCMQRIFLVECRWLPRAIPTMP